MKKFLSFMMMFALCLTATLALAQVPKGYVSVYELRGDAEITPLNVNGAASYQLLGPANGWGDLADNDFSKYRKLVINFDFDPVDAGKMVAVRFNVNSAPGAAKVKLEKFTLPTSGTNFSAVIDLEKYEEDGKLGVGGIVFYNGASHWSFNYDDGSPATKAVTVKYVAVGDEKPDPTKIPADFVSVYKLRGDAEITPLNVNGAASYQLLGPANGWGDLADNDFSKYRKLVVNLTFDPADAGKMVAIRFNVNSAPGAAQVKLEKFTLPASGTNFSAVIDLTKYAQDGKVGVGGIVFYNGASHWSFNYDDGTPATKAVTVNYVAVGDEIIDPTVLPKNYVSVYKLRGDAEITPLNVNGAASYQLLGPANGWGDLADNDFSKYEHLVINLTFDPADAGKMVAVRFNVNSVPGTAKVKLEKFTLPLEGDNFSVVIDLQKYAEEGKIGVGGIVYYNGASHWSFNYDDGSPATKAVTVNYVAVGPVTEEPAKPTTKLLVNKVLEGNVNDAADYECIAYLRWDDESIYINFEIKDDVLYDGAGNVWDNDNIEIYFDMDNSKNPTWPRNAGWPASSYDDNDYQLRILPGKEWSAYNSIEGVDLVTTMKDGGYDISVVIPWASLMEGFVPAPGTQIGFDILASDNDNDNRTQITWYASTVMPWNDASLFGTLEFVDGGTFKPIPDVTAPSKPEVTAETDKSNVTLSWPLVTDNIAVMYYTVKQDGVIINEKMYANEGGNTITVKDLADGNYKFTVTAYDNSGNSSNSVVDVEIITTSVNEIMNGFKAYPNPSNGIVNVISGSNSASVIEVFNLTGERIMSQSFINNCSVDLSNNIKGVYFLRVTTNDKVNVAKIDIR